MAIKNVDDRLERGVEKTGGEKKREEKTAVIERVL